MTKIRNPSTAEMFPFVAPLRSVTLSRCMHIRVRNSEAACPRKFPSQRRMQPRPPPPAAPPSSLSTRVHSNLSPVGVVGLTRYDLASEYILACPRSVGGCTTDLRSVCTAAVRSAAFCASNCQCKHTSFGQCGRLRALR